MTRTEYERLGGREWEIGDLAKLIFMHQNNWLSVLAAYQAAEAFVAEKERRWVEYRALDTDGKVAP